MYLNETEIQKFTDWLVQRGAVLESPRSEWEVLRFLTDTGLHSVYRNSKNEQTWSNSAKALHESSLRNRQIGLSPERGTKRKLRHLAKDIAERDGPECWYCALQFEDPTLPVATMEHLVSRSHGGPDHMSNLVLSCQPCNMEAGNLSVSEKVRLRETKRGHLVHAE